MLKTSPLHQHAWRDNPWAGFLEHTLLSRSDGLWLSDLTDFVPVEMRHSLAMPKRGARENRLEDRNLLMPILGLKAGQIRQDNLIVAGYWALPGDVNITVRTVLCDPSDALALAFATITGSPFFRWLPHDTNHIDRLERKMSVSMRPWLKHVEHYEMHLDRHDPYAATTALRRESPEDWVAAVPGVSQRDAAGRFWDGAAPAAFQAQAWGQKGGRGEDSWDRSGHRIQSSTSVLRELLRGQQKALVGLISARHFLRDKESRAGGDHDAFVYRTSAFIFDHHLRVRMPVNIPLRVQKAIAGLDDRDRSEFDARLEVITRLRTRKPSRRPRALR